MTDDNTQRAIGDLQGQMKGVDRRLGEIIDLIKSQDERSSASRARMHEAQEKTAREVHDLGRRVENVEEAVKVMNPVVKQVEKLRERAWGIILLFLFAWAILGGVILEGVTWLGQAAIRAITGAP